MIDVPEHHTAVPFQMRLPVSGILSQRPVSVAHAVGLDIGLIHDVETVTVTHIVPAGVVGIVTGTHSIDIKALHYLYIPQHLLLRDQIPALRAHLVPVGALDEHRLTVDQKLAVLYLHLAESHIDGHLVRHSVLTHGHSLQAVQPGSLSRPFAWGAHIGRSFELTVLSYLSHRGPHGLSFRGPQRKSDSSHSVRHITLYRKTAVAVRRIQVRYSLHCLHALLGPGVHITFPGDTGKPPEILVLKISAVTPAENLERKQIVPGLYEVSDVKHGLQFAVLAVTHVLTVDIKGDIGGYRAEMYEDVPVPDPVLRYLDRSPVGSDMVLELRHMRRVILEEIAPGISDIEVQGIAIAVEFPDSGNRHGAPSAVIVVRPVVIHRTVPGILHPVEFPDTVQRDRLRIINVECSAHRHTVDLIHSGIAPDRVRIKSPASVVRLGLCSYAERRQHRQQ